MSGAHAASPVISVWGGDVAAGLLCDWGGDVAAGLLCGCCPVTGAGSQCSRSLWPPAHGVAYTQPTVTYRPAPLVRLGLGTGGLNQ